MMMAPSTKSPTMCQDGPHSFQHIYLSEQIHEIRHHSHSIDEKAKAQRSLVTHLRAHSW